MSGAVIVTTLYLDTHVLVWLAKRNKKITVALARKLEKTEFLYYSPASILELSLLEEIGRLKYSAQECVGHLEERFQIAPSPHDFADVCRQAGTFSWTRDPFDRLIVADSMLAKAGLVTADECIHKHYKKAIW